MPQEKVLPEGRQVFRLVDPESGERGNPVLITVKTNSSEKEDKQ